MKHSLRELPDSFLQSQLPPPEPSRPSWQVSLSAIGEDVPDTTWDPGRLLLATEEEPLASVHDLMLWRALSGLPPRERLVICWRYGLGCEPIAQELIADRLGCTGRWAYELEQRGLALLRGELYRRFLAEAA